MNCEVTTIIKVITIKVIIFISSEPMRKDTISCILLLQKFRIIISSIIALITYIKESHRVDDFAKMDIFLEFPPSLMLDQILGNVNHFQNLYQFLHQTERWLVT